jgi:hypothetical protein
MLSTYLNGVVSASLLYVANFTLQRKEEVASLRASCLIWEDDSKLGRIPIICGETTKTDHDSDARWVASPSIEAAIKALTAIANLRMVCDRQNPLIAATEMGSNRALEYLNANSIDIGSSAGLAALLARANGSPIRAPYSFRGPNGPRW